GVAALVGSVLVLLLEPAVGAPSPAGLAEALVPALALLVGGRTLLRLLAGGLRGRGGAAQRALLVGHGPDAHELLDNVDAWPGLGVEVVGVCADTSARDVCGRPVLGLTRSAHLVARALGVRTVVL